MIVGGTLSIYAWHIGSVIRKNPPDGGREPALHKGRGVHRSHREGRIKGTKRTSFQYRRFVEDAAPIESPI